MKEHPFQKGIEKSNEELKETSLNVYGESKKNVIHHKKIKKQKKLTPRT